MTKQARIASIRLMQRELHVGKRDLRTLWSDAVQALALPLPTRPLPPLRKFHVQALHNLSLAQALIEELPGFGQVPLVLDIAGFPDLRALRRQQHPVLAELQLHGTSARW